MWASNASVHFLRRAPSYGGAVREFFVRMADWGVTLTQEQCMLLLEPFDVDLNGRLDFNE